MMRKVVSIILLLFHSHFINSDEISFVHCQTTKGPLKIEIHPNWSPLGAQRFVELVKDGFFTDIALYRCVNKFLTQFGISDNPEMKHWHGDTIQDDPNLNLGIKKNYVSFAGGGPNTRSSQIFIAFEELDFLGKAPWETPFGVVIEGQETLDNFYKEYGDIPPFGQGPDQQKIYNRGYYYYYYFLNFLFIY
jgi:cyclophilin family peptidyl-prolyl cis-trans isomerase